MIPSSLVKQPYDKRRICIDFSDALYPGDTVSSVVGVTAWEGVTDRTSTIISGSPALTGNKVYTILQAGSDGITYNIRIRVLTTNGDQLEDDISLVVRENS
jgi:hypothetical protein